MVLSKLKKSRYSNYNFLTFARKHKRCQCVGTMLAPFLEIPNCDTMKIVKGKSNVRVICVRIPEKIVFTNINIRSVDIV